MRTIVIIAILVAVVLLIGGGILLWRRRKKQKTAAKEQAALPVTPIDPARAQKTAQRIARISALVAEELAVLDRNVGGKDGRYAMPWCLVLGVPGAGQSTLLANNGLHVPFRGASDEKSDAAGCRFWYYDKGVAIDVSSDVVQDEDAFRHLCSLLQSARPKRPLDCAVVVLPTTEFIGETRLTDEKLKAVGESLYQRLQLLQQIISLIIPTYVVVSKGDMLPGFTAFCAGLTPALREQMLGWSSPYEPGQSYDASWMEQAAAALYSTQCALQLDLLASGKLSDKERDSAFLMPRNTQSLKEPLTLLLDQLYRSSVYSESNLLRGIYLTGDAAVESAMVRSPQSIGKRQPVFLLHLFSKKIFTETGLARPLRRSLLTGAQTLRAIKIAVAASALIGALLLWSAHANLSRDTRVVVGFLDKVPTEQSGSVAQDKDRFAQRTQELLAAIGDVATARLMSLRLPTSWVSSLDAKVQDVMQSSFETVVLAGLHQGLELKARQALSLDGDTPGSSGVAPGSDEPPPAGEAWPGGDKKRVSERPTSKLVQVQALRAMPEFQELHELAHGYGEFAAQVETYNRLGSDQHKRFDTVPPLVKYVFGVDLEQRFIKNSEFYADALANASYRPFELRTVSPKVVRRAREICRALHQRLFVDNAVGIEIEEIQRFVSRLKAESETSAADLPTLVELRDVLQRLERDLQRPELSFMAKESLELGDAFVDLLNDLRSLSPGGELADEVKLGWQTAHQQQRRRLLEEQLPALGPILLRDNEKNRLAMTPGVQNLKAGLESFLALPFVQQSIERPQAQTPDGAYKVSWNEDLLRQSISQADGYESYVRDRVGQVYQVIREVVKHSALEKLGQNMPALVAQARHVERVLRFAGDINALQDEISSEVADLKRVSLPLRSIIETYDRLGLKTANSELYQQLEEDNRELLRRIDLLLEREDMYRVSSKLSDWRGEKAPVFPAFDVEDSDALAQYIKAQRNRIKGWARDYAKVPVSLLDGLTSAGNSGDPLVSKWRNIVTQLEYFEKMTPGNSVKEMESFMDTTLVTVTPDNCLDKLPRRSGDISDFFLQTRSRIYDAVRKRCLVFAQEKLLELYNHLAVRFNRDLAGKFPFTRVAQALDDTDASPRDIRGFYQEYDEFMQRYDAYVARRETSGGAADVGREVNAFLASLREVRPFFAQLLVDRGNDIARYNLTLEYRVNKGNEINGQQIAEWGFSSADQKVEDGQGVWQVGDRLRLSMRWAKDGPYVPSPDGQVRGAVVDSNDTISFEFAGMWSLIRMVRLYRASNSDMRKSLDRQPHVLKFLVDIQERKRTGRLRLLPDAYYTGKGSAPTGAAKASFLYNKAVVFLRLGFSAQDSKEPLVLPVDWPAVAPITRGAQLQGG